MFQPNEGIGPTRFGDVFRLELDAILRARPVEDSEEHAAMEVPESRAAIEGSSDRAPRSVHRLGLVGMALSGGGVRSATFNLGLVQALCERRLLSLFDYMSTVSGGGYVGTFVQSLLAKAADVTEVEDRLAPQPGVPERLELRHLREYSRYLTPRMGALSLDTVTLAVAYLVSLAANVAVLVCVMGASLLLVYVHFAAFRWIATSELLGPCGSEALWPCGWLRNSPAYTLVFGLLFAFVFIFKEPSAPIRVPEGKVPWLRRERVGRSLRLLLVDALVVLPVVLSAWLWSVRLWIDPAPGLFQVVFAGMIFGGVFGVSFWRISVWSVAAARDARGNEKGGFRFRLLRLRDGIGVWVSSSLTLTAVLLLVRAALRALKAPEYANDLALMASFGPAAGLATVAAALATYSVFAGPFLEDLHRERISALTGIFARLSVWMLAIVVLVIHGPPLLTHGENLLTREGLAVAAGWLLTTAGALWASGRADGGNRLFRWLAPPLLKVAPWIFITGLLVLIAAVLDHVLRGWSGGAAPFFDLVLVIEGAVALAAVAAILSYAAGANEGSIYALYRNRLVRAYLGAARADERRPGIVTGFDGADDLRLPAFKTRPLAIYNAALSLLSKPSLAWQYRKARPFTFTPLHCGFARETDSFFRPAARYGGGLKAGDAMAISGAAVAPSLGRRSSPAMGFLLTLFNLRMGMWLPNPRDQRSWAAPRHRIGSVFLLVRELLGMTDDMGAAIYVSDGGHFENLGLYELVRRRCRFILASDASEDRRQAFDSLAGAVEQIRVDFGVDIEIDVEGLRRSAETGHSEHHVALGRIVYDRGDPETSLGVLVYVRATLTGDEPADVLSYAHGHPDFPNQSTGDQWFDESQFEAYRALGLHVGRRLCDTLGVAEYKGRRGAERVFRLWAAGTGRRPATTPNKGPDLLPQPIEPT